MPQIERTHASRRVERAIPLTDQPAQQAQPAPTPTSGGPGADDGIVIGTDGSVDIKPETDSPELLAALAVVKKSEQYTVIKSSNPDFAQGVRIMVTGHEQGDDRQMIAGYGQVTAGVLGKAVNGQPIGDTNGAPQYDKLPESAEATAEAIDQYGVETHNAHVDSGPLAKGGKILGNLILLDNIFGDAQTQLTQVMAPLGRNLATSVTAVYQAVLPELPRNLGLKGILAVAIDYVTSRSAKGQQTKKKIAKAKASHTATSGGTAAGGGAAAGGATGEKSNLR